MLTRRLLAAVLIISSGSAWARSLSDTLDVFQPGAVTITPSILRLQRALARATDLPATTTTPGYTYRFDPESGAYVRVTGTLGPAFLERAETIGKGRLDLSASYLYAHFTESDGRSLDQELSSKFVTTFDDLVVPQRIDTRNFSLTSHVTYFSATYGVDDRTDVNLLLPVYYTVMRGERRFTFFGTTGEGFSSLDDDSLGAGDLLLRAKRRFYEWNSVDVAAGFSLRLPSGNPDNFQGIGDVILTPSLIASWIGPAVELHGSLGVDIDASDLQQSALRWGVGASWAPLERLTLLVDLIGTTQFSDDDLTFVVPDPRLVTIRGEFNPPLQARAVGNATEFTTTLERLDIIDVAVGFKVNLYGNLICFLGAIVPLTEDGPQPEVIPTGGIQYGF